MCKHVCVLVRIRTCAARRAHVFTLALHLRVCTCAYASARMHLCAFMLTRRFAQMPAATEPLRCDRRNKPARKHAQIHTQQQARVNTCGRCAAQVRIRTSTHTHTHACPHTTTPHCARRCTYTDACAHVHMQMDIVTPMVTHPRAQTHKHIRAGACVLRTYTRSRGAEGARRRGAQKGRSRYVAGVCASYADAHNHEQLHAQQVRAIAHARLHRISIMTQHMHTHTHTHTHTYMHEAPMQAPMHT
jgi:hypothetical protein